MTIFSSLHYHHPPSPSSPHPIHSISNPFTPTTHQTTTIIHPSSPTLTLIHIHPYELISIWPPTLTRSHRSRSSFPPDDYHQSITSRVARSIRSSPPPPTPSSARRSPIEPPPQLGCLRSSSGLPVSPGLPNSLPGRTIDSSLGSHPLQREFQPVSQPSTQTQQRPQKKNKKNSSPFLSSRFDSPRDLLTHPRRSFD